MASATTVPTFPKSLQTSKPSNRDCAKLKATLDVNSFQIKSQCNVQADNLKQMLDYLILA